MGSEIGDCQSSINIVSGIDLIEKSNQFVH